VQHVTHGLPDVIEIMADREEQGYGEASEPNRISG
jgi:hypothetical protein